MAINFPNLPANGTRYVDVANGQGWVYDSTNNSWTAEGVASPGMTYKGGTDGTATAPTGAQTGWVYSSIGTGNIHTSFTGLTGTIVAGELLIYDGTNWQRFASSVPTASEVAAGKAEIATQAEVTAGTDDTRIVTPLKLATAIPTATETAAGKAEIATQAEVTTGTDDSRIVTPLKLATAVSAATETSAGKAEIATQAEVTAGTDDERIVTPLKLATANTARDTANDAKFVEVAGDTMTGNLTVNGTLLNALVPKSISRISFVDKTTPKTPDTIGIPITITGVTSGTAGRAIMQVTLQTPLKNRRIIATTNEGTKGNTGIDTMVHVLNADLPTFLVHFEHLITTKPPALVLVIYGDV